MGKIEWRERDKPGGLRNGGKDDDNLLKAGALVIVDMDKDLIARAHLACAQNCTAGSWSSKRGSCDKGNDGDNTQSRRRLG